MMGGVFNAIRGGMAQVVDGGLRLGGALFGRAVEAVRNNPRAALATAVVTTVMIARTLHQRFTAVDRNIQEVRPQNPELAQRLTTLQTTGNLTRSQLLWVTDVAKRDPLMTDPGTGVLPQPLNGGQPKLLVTFPLDKATQFQDLYIAFQNEPGFVFDVGNRRVDIAYSGEELMQLSFVNVGMGPLILQSSLDAAIPGGIPEGLPLEQRLNKAFMPPAQMRVLQGDRLNTLVETQRRADNFDYGTFDGRFSETTLDELRDDLGDATTGADQVRIALEGQQGMVMGESHGNAREKTFLVQNMGALAANGVTTLYLEHIWENHQPLLDQWFNQRDPLNPHIIPPMPPVLAEVVQQSDLHHNLTNPNSLHGVLEAAFREGIRPVGFDSRSAQSGVTGTSGAKIRTGAMNLKAEQSVQGQNGGKFVLLVGRDHSNTQPGFSRGIPGLSQMLGIPALVSTDGTSVTLDRENIGNRRAG